MIEKLHNENKGDRYIMISFDESRVPDSFGRQILLEGDGKKYFSIVATSGPDDNGYWMIAIEGSDGISGFNFTLRETLTKGEAESFMVLFDEKTMISYGDHCLIDEQRLCEALEGLKNKIVEPSDDDIEGDCSGDGSCGCTYDQSEQETRIKNIDEVITRIHQNNEQEKPKETVKEPEKSPFATSLTVFGRSAVLGMDQMRDESSDQSRDYYYGCSHD